MTTPVNDQAGAINPNFAQLCRSPSLMLAFGFGSGLAPKAPGTFGTLVAIPFYFLLRELQIGIYIAIVAAAFVIGISICTAASRQLQVHDHSGIVWDEIVGYWLTMLLAPPAWWWMVVGFILFRFFDIVKPWPISVADKKVSGGVGIMLDDVLAAVYAFIGLQFIAWLTTGYRFF